LTHEYEEIFGQSALGRVRLARGVRGVPRALGHVLHRAELPAVSGQRRAARAERGEQPPALAPHPAGPAELQVFAGVHMLPHRRRQGQVPILSSGQQCMARWSQGQAGWSRNAGWRYRLSGAHTSKAGEIGPPPPAIRIRPPSLAFLMSAGRGGRLLRIHGHVRCILSTAALHSRYDEVVYLESAAMGRDAHSQTPSRR
jgi:hypothetical protein